MWRDHPEVTQFFQVGDRDSSFESDDDQGDNQSSDDYDSSEQDSGLPKVNVNIFSYLECDDWVFRIWNIKLSSHFSLSDHSSKYLVLT